MFVYPTERKRKTFQAPKRVKTGAAPASKKTPDTKSKSTPTYASLDVGLLFAILLSIQNFQYVIPSFCPFVEGSE